MKSVGKCLVLLLAIIWCAKSQSDSTVIVPVNSSHQLEKLLCHHSHNILHNKNAILLLNATITHIITSGTYCTVNISRSLTIASNSPFALAHIQCEAQRNKNWTRGFAFSGPNGSFIMRRLNFTNCGAILNTTIIHSMASPFHFTQYHAATLVFNDIASLLVDTVTIIDYTGFAIVAVNLQNASFHVLNISYSQMVNIYNHSIGSGVLILYRDRISQAPVIRYNLSILNSAFSNINASFNQKRLHGAHNEIHGFLSSSMPVVNAAGLTILYSQNDSEANVLLSGNSFKSCHGYLAGALLIIQLNSSVHSQTIINGSHFTNNSIFCHCHGAAIAAKFYFNNKNATYQPLIITNGTFYGNGYTSKSDGCISGGAIDIAVVKADDAISKLLPLLYFVFRSLNFSGNAGYKSGTCIYAAVYPNVVRVINYVHVTLESIIAHSNPSFSLLPTKRRYIPVSLFHFSNIHFIVINGTERTPGNFSYNYGSVFEIMHSKMVVLQGYLLFDSNIGNHGAAIVLSGNSYLYLEEGLRANFINNTVQSLGGAIYATGSTSYYCTFQSYNKNTSNISLNFINNTAALAGNAIYSTRLYRCFSANNYVKNWTEFYNTIIHNASSPTDISSFAEEIVVCNGIYDYRIYPGGTVHVPISVRDYNNSSTYEVVTVIVVEQSSVLKKVNWWFSNYQGTFAIKGMNSCSIVNLTVHTNDRSSLGKSALFLFTIAEENKVINNISVTLMKCPLGFQFKKFTGTCVCSDVWNKILTQEGSITCNVDNNTFSKPNSLNIWFGTGSAGKQFLVSSCNPSYCNFDSQFNLLHFNTTGSYLSSSDQTMPLCFGSRTGDLCGQCITNYSVILGSTECKHCFSVWWPFTSIIYILTGPLLVLIFYTLKLTLTVGTLNGIIFYAQIAYLGVIEYFDRPCTECGKESFFVNFSYLFISWINLNPGISHCFFHGMTELWKAGLTLVFPVYLLLIVGFLITLSRFSVKVSNRLSNSSIQVLVTIVHLSFTKLLQSLIEVFSSTFIFSEGKSEPKRVWYMNGAVAYGCKEHIWLMTITSIIVGIILIPYMVIILFGKLIMRFDKAREYIRPVYEAIHAPYRLNKWYWFALQQLFLLLVYSFATLDGSKSYCNFSLSLLLTAALYLHAHSRPFKNRLLNLLNCFLLFNLILVLLVTQYLDLTNSSPKLLVMFFAFSNYPVFVVFCVIIIYHILLSTNQTDRAYYLYTLIIGRCAYRRPSQHFHYQSTDDDAKAREPLLEHL